jgi:hypothetical protein
MCSAVCWPAGLILLHHPVQPLVIGSLQQRRAWHDPPGLRRSHAISWNSRKRLSCLGGLVETEANSYWQAPAIKGRRSTVQRRGGYGFDLCLERLEKAAKREPLMLFGPITSIV